MDNVIPFPGIRRDRSHYEQSIIDIAAEVGLDPIKRDRLIERLQPLIERLQTSANISLTVPRDCVQAFQDAAQLIGESLAERDFALFLECARREAECYLHEIAPD